MSYGRSGAGAVSKNSAGPGDFHESRRVRGLGSGARAARLARDAEKIIRATLETLGERLEADFADKIAAQLPPEIGRHLRSDVIFERLSLDDFVRRVCAREGEGSELPDAVFHARRVLEVLQTALNRGLVEKLHAALPADFEPLLEGSQGRMRSGDERRV